MKHSTIDVNLHDNQLMLEVDMCPSGSGDIGDKMLRQLIESTRKIPGNLMVLAFGSTPDSNVIIPIDIDNALNIIGNSVGSMCNDETVKKNLQGHLKGISDILHNPVLPVAAEKKEALPATAEKAPAEEKVSDKPAEKKSRKYHS